MQKRKKGKHIPKHYYSSSFFKHAKAIIHLIPKLSHLFPTFATNEIKDAVEEKKRAYRKMLQRNFPEEVKARRKSKYKEWMEVTEGKVSEEQGGFRKERGCIDQIFAMKRLVEE